jgi:SPP1 family predicted phage head-tail adaptor
MGYSAGMLDRRVTILNRLKQVVGRFGIDSDGVGWEETGTVWCNVSWVKGLSAMREGSADVYGMLLIRMRYNKMVNRNSRVRFDGVIYEVLGDTFHTDRRADTIQFTAREVYEE